MASKTKQIKKVTASNNLSISKKSLDQDTQGMIDILQGSKPYHEKLKYVKNELEESVREINFSYKVFGFLEDVAYAISRAVKEVHGFTTQDNIKGPSKDNPPEMIDVKFADGSRIKVPIGTIQLPQFGKGAYIEMYYNSKDITMNIDGVCEKRYTTLMDAIMQKAEFIVKTDSIYKNQAIKYSGSGSPEFMDLSGIDNIELFLTEQAKFATEPIEARIEKCDECELNGIDLKFGALLEGDYGTGKTLYASKLALKAIINDWTFIYSSKPQATLEVLKIANKFTSNGKGVVLFIEDIDKVLMERNTITNEISLLMDGSETKNNNIITIFSTNHIENIDPTFLRGKRIGTIVTLTYLDKVTAKNMIEYYLGDKLADGCEKAAEKVEEYEIVPAFLAEIIDRVKTHLVLRSTTEIYEKDILAAIEQFKRQMDIARVKTDSDTHLERMYNSSEEIAHKQFNKFFDDSGYKTILEDLKDYIS